MISVLCSKTGLPVRFYLSHIQRPLILFFWAVLLMAGCEKKNSENAEDQDVPKVERSSVTTKTVTENSGISTPKADNQGSPEVSQAVETATSPVEEPDISDSGDSQKTLGKNPVDSSLYEGLPLRVTHIGEMLHEGGNTVGIRFSVPLDGAEPFGEHVNTANKVSHWVLSENGLYLYLVNAKPDATYHVIVSPGLKAANGETLATRHWKKVPISPAPPSLGFGGDGHFLVQGFHTGLPVVAQNVPRANASFFKVFPSHKSLLAMLRWKRQGTRESYWRLDDINKFASLVYEGSFELNPERNKRRTVNLPIQQIPALEGPGVYIAIMDVPGKFSDPLAVTWYSVTDLGVHLRNYGSGFEVYVHSLATGKPVEKAYIELVASNAKNTSGGATDKQGRIRFDEPFWGKKTLIATHRETTTLFTPNTGALDLSDFGQGERMQTSKDLFVYGPRDIYRGGETVTFSALFRTKDGKFIHSSAPLTAVLFRPDGQRIQRFLWRSDGAGYYEHRHALPAEAQTGKWRLEITGQTKQPVVYHFQVEDFLPERLKITWNPENKPTFRSAKEALSVDLIGEYLYGAPAAGNRFDAKYRVSPQPHPFEQWPEHHFGDPEEDNWNQTNTLEKLKLNKEGRLSLKIPGHWSKATVPLRVQIMGSLFESGGRSVNRLHTENLLPAKQLVGIRPLFKENVPANSRAEFELILTDSAGKLLSSPKLEARLINRTTRYHWRYRESRGWYQELAKENIAETIVPVSIAAGKKAKITLPVKWGQYRLAVVDAKTGLKSAFDFEAGSPRYWSYAQSFGQSVRPDQVSLALDKEAYLAGEIAKLKIAPPAAGETLVIVESDRPLWSTRIHTPATGLVLDIPVGEDWDSHDIYVSALHLQPADNQKRITPTRSIGLLHLPLERAHRKLEVKIDAPEKWLPNQEVEARVQVLSADATPVEKAWLTLAAVDVGVLSLTDFETPDPFGFFFARRLYGVDQYDMYHQLIELNRGKIAKLRFGGDGFLSRGGDMARSEAQIVSLYSGKVDVKNGEAKVPLKLPEFNGRLRLMAVAFDHENFGHAEREVTVAAPVVTQIALPRFVAIGDRASAALDVTNLSGSTVHLRVGMGASGPALMGAKEEKFKLEHKEKRTLIYPFEAIGNAGRIEFRANIQGVPDYPLERSWGLNTRQPYPALTERLSGILGPGESISLESGSLAGFLPETLRAQAVLNNQANLNPHRQLEQLLRYPYGCLEQSISSTYPWLYASEEQLSALNLSQARAERRQQALKSGMERITKLQANHGGFTLWSPNKGNEEHWLTAYATHFFTDALDEGIKVDAGVLKKSLQRLRVYGRGGIKTQNRWLPAPEVYEFASRAYAHYILSRHNKASLSDIRRQAKEVPEKTNALSLLHLAIAAKLQGDKQLFETLLTDYQNAENRVSGYIGDYGSGIRDKARQARLLWQHQIDDLRAGTLTREIAEEIRKRRYLSTQERIAVFQAALQQEKHQGGNWLAELRMGNFIEEKTGSKNLLTQYADPSLKQGASITNLGEGLLYADLIYQGYSDIPPEARSEGQVSISRRYLDARGKPLPIREGAILLKTGQQVLVELSIDSKKYRPDLLVVDLLPAGLELENQNLANSLRLDDLKLDGKSMAEWNSLNDIRHEEFRDDRYVAALATGKGYGRADGSRVFYLARAVTPGTYKVPNPLLEDMYEPEVRAVGTTLDRLVIEHS